MTAERSFVLSGLRVLVLFRRTAALLSEIFLVKALLFGVTWLIQVMLCPRVICGITLIDIFLILDRYSVSVALCRLFLVQLVASCVET